MRKARWSCAVAVTALALSAVPAHAAPGDLDLTFSRDGKASTHLTPRGGSDIAYGVALHDGKIVAVGQATDTFAVVRYNGDGTLDESFDGDGVATTPAMGKGIAYAVAVQDDGKIVAAGQADNDAFLVVRYNTDGSLDDSFGEGGKVLISLTGGPDVAYTVLLQPDDKIVVAGQAGTGGINDFALVRLNGDGTRDGDFGENGVVTANSGDDAFYAVVLQEGNIVAAGGSDDSLVVARFDSKGVPDPSFSGDGFAPAGTGTAFAVALQGDKILVGGSSSVAFRMARFDSSGALDVTFGNEGLAVDTMPSANDATWAMLPLDDKIVLAGRIHDSFGLVRYTADGVLDRHFGDNGTRTEKFAGDAAAIAMAKQNDGKIVLAGYHSYQSEAGSVTDFAVARFEPLESTEQPQMTGNLN